MGPSELTANTPHDQTALPGFVCPSVPGPSSFVRGINPRAQAIHGAPELTNQSFADGIVASLSSLRSFAISLTRNVDQAEDLVQETVLRAITKQEQFEAGTNLQAWLFAILRNLFCSALRKMKHEVEDADGFYAATLVSIPDDEDRIMLKELLAAVANLPLGQRQAIMLVGTEGMTYEEAAQALGCAIGTIQSRVSRARSRLAELLDHDQTDRHRRGAAKTKRVFC
jgi:RNA polymerase sigma-70 factor (ECF subfamily)